MLRMLIVLQSFDEASKSLYQTLSDASMQIIICSLCLGFITMSLLEYLKRSLRVVFNEFKFLQWLNFISSKIFLIYLIRYLVNFRYRSTYGMIENNSHNMVFIDLLNLAMAGDLTSLFSLPTRNLAGQLSLVAESVLEDPKNHENLLYSLVSIKDAGSILDSDMDVLLGVERAERHPYINEKVIYSSEQYLESRNRIANHIQRRIDAFQIDCGNSWITVMQTAAMVLSLVLTSILLSTVSIRFSFGNILLLGVVGYLSAFLAGIFRKILKRVERVER